MSLSDALHGDTYSGRPEWAFDLQPSSTPAQDHHPTFQSFEEWIQDGVLEASGQGENPVAASEQYPWYSNLDLGSPQVTYSSSVTHNYTPPNDGAYFYGADPSAYNPTYVFGMPSGETLPGIDHTTAMNPTDYTGAEHNTPLGYLVPSSDSATSAPNSWSYPSTSASGNPSISVVPCPPNSSQAPESQMTGGSFASRWGKYQDLSRDNDPIVLDEISKEHISITRQRKRNEKMFRKELRDQALPRPHRFRLCLNLPEDFGCRFTVVFKHRKPWKTLGYPRDKSKDDLPENRHIHYPVGVDYEQWGDLEAGWAYQVARDADPTPESILNGTWQRSHDLVVYLPRPFEYCGGPTFTVLCSYKGTPGPNVHRLAKDILNARDLDDYTGTWMVNNWHRYIGYSVAIQWPGYPKKYFKFNNGKLGIANGYRYTILHAVAKFLWKYMVDAKNGRLRYVRTARTEDWKLKKGEDRISKVRLMAINYYRHVFFPILAVDVTVVQEEAQGPSVEDDYMGCDAEQYEN